MAGRTETLTDKQRSFVEVYLANGRCGSAAYRTAYDPAASDRRAAEQASKLLVHPKIAPLIAAAEARAQQATERVTDRYAITRERVMTELAAVAFGQVTDYARPNAKGDPEVSFADLSPGQRAALSELTVDVRSDESGAEIKRVRFRLHDKISALTRLAAMHGWERKPPAVFALPAVKAPADLPVALSAVVAAAAGGVLTIDEAQGLAGLLELNRRAIETADHEQRLAALERAAREQNR